MKRIFKNAISGVQGLSVILLSNGEYLELKNKIYTSTGLSSADADQLIDGYFRNINSIDDFTWELKWAKNKSVWSSTSQAEIAMKEKWKVIFLNREQEIFEIIWNNQNFRNNIFEINISRIDAELDFHDFISNSSSIIYNFIKVR